MAKKSEGRTFNVSVIGLSGTEREKGATGVGKSCLCNRFVYQVADKYHHDHISVLSQSDFAGRVINNDHFLYWGDVTKTDEGNNFTFHVVEQTEFIDDVSFQPFKTGRTDPYCKRALALKVQSAEKLMYICKEQLGMETDSAYEQKVIPEGKLCVDGFICCFDVSHVQQRPVEKQVEFVTVLINSALKTRKPVVLVTTKNDEADERCVKEVEKLMSRQFRGSVPLVETASHENVNIELAFMTLAHLIDKSKARTKIVPFSEAIKARKEILDVATEAYRNLLRGQITDCKIKWTSARKRLEKEQDFGHYVDLFGTDSALKLFRQHTKQLRDEQVRRREQHYLMKLPDILQQFLPDLSTILESWNACQHYISLHPDFCVFFVDPDEDGWSWKDTELVDNYEETRLPFDLLASGEAETCFRNHLNALQAQYRRLELKKQFRKLLDENPQVTPGKPLSDCYVFFVGKECYNGLEEHERLQVYEEHLIELKHRAKNEFQELLWERSDMFMEITSAGRSMTSDDLKQITKDLQEDYRYRRLDKLEEDRKVMILNHLGFMQCPSKDRCYFRELCMESQVMRILAEKLNKSVSVDTLNSADDSIKPLNLVLLGREGLATDLYQQIRHLFPGDEFVCQNMAYSLDYRPIDGDVSQEQNAFATANFKPHGCLCVYSSTNSLEYVRASLETTLLFDLQQEEDPSLQGLPIAIIQAYNPGYSEKELLQLREQGQQLARRLQSEFIDIPGDDDFLDTRQFDPRQIEEALISVVKGSRPSRGGRPLSEQMDPELRIALCMMCGDAFPVDVPLGPLLNHESCHVTSEPHNTTITIHTYLEFSKQTIELTISSYHGSSVKEGFFHGYILVYSAKRKASLATMRAFSETLPPVPILILAVTDSGGASTFFTNESSQTNLTEGSALADKILARFMTTTANFQQQTAIYNSFFKEAWAKHEEIENLYCEEPSPPAYSERNLCHLDKRPPAPLPKPFDTYQTTKSSTSNSQSTEDSEPLYSEPMFRGSDSEHERASSTSPPPFRPQSPVTDRVIYAEPGQPNGDHLVKPSMVKSRRAQYAGEWRDNNMFASGGSQISDETIWTENLCYSKNKPQPLDKKYQHVQSALSQQLRHNRKLSGGPVQAPLAVPEPIGIAADYGTVKDAVYSPTENDYDLVMDALPPGKLHRIKSTQRKQEMGATDSEDSEFSSLERDNKKDIYSKYNRRPTPHKKKHKQRPVPPVKVPVLSDDSHHLGVQDESIDRGHSNSLSEGSDNTGDELQDGRKEKKPRSFKKKSKSPTSDSIGFGAFSPPMSDSDNYFGSPPAGHVYDEEHSYEQVTTKEFYTIPRYGHMSGTSEDGDLDLNDSGHWTDKFRMVKGGQKDTLSKLKKKEEKRIKDDVRRKQKEEEKKQKEQQKLQKKIKKKDSKASGTSENGIWLNDFPMSPSNPSVPYFIERCVEFIEEEGLLAEGIYRIPGNKAQVDLLTANFNEDPNVDIRTLDIQVNAVATVLKAFINDLTDPLVPLGLYDELVEAFGVFEKSSRLIALRGVLRKLHPLNFEVLKYLITHLRRVSQNSGENSMTSYNLALCWWPTLIRLEFTSIEKMAAETRCPIEIIQVLIEQCGFFFHGENEV